MEPALTEIIAGGLAAAVIGVLINLLSAFLESRLPKSIEIKVGGVTFEIKGSSKNDVNEIVDKIIELQEFPRVFISYSHADREFARRLAHDLRSRGINVWLADEQIAVGDSIKDRIQEGISESQWVIFIIPSEGLESNWVSLELEAALEREQRRKRGLVLPVLYQGSKVPKVLQGRAYADFRDDYNEGLNRLLEKLKPETQNAA